MCRTDAQSLRPLRVCSLIILALLALTMPSYAQTNHAQHHAYYQNWVNQKGNGCCNNQDCGELKPENERTVADHIEVRIDGEWCPVGREHYLKSGNAPDWATSHVCVAKNYESNVTVPPCQRLLCYQPKPGT